MRKTIRQCVDRTPDVSQLEACAFHALAERPSNAAMGLDLAVAAGILLPARIAFITAKRWADAKILLVGFLGGTLKQRGLVMDTASLWSEHCSIGFKWDVRPEEADIRVAFARGMGSWSMIGTDARTVPAGQPTVNFGWDDPATILHEFGHVLGCIHEHQSPAAAIPWNRDAVYRFYAGPPNRWNRETVDWNVFGKYSQTLTNHSEYDPASIMHYPIAPELLTDPSAAVPFNRSLSLFDIAFVGEMYPLPREPRLVLEGGLPPGSYRLVREAASSLN